MRRHVRLGAMVAVGALGMASAMALSAGASDVKACLSKSGVVSAMGPTARCAAGRSVITISGDAFKRGRRGTITINGVPFRKGSRTKAITINGNSFRTGTLPNTLTINGNPFRSSGNTLTINGTSFRSSGNTLTINGTSFRSSGNTLTINGTAFGPGAAVTQGPQGERGPAGPAGTVAPGAAPVEVAKVSVAGAAGPVSLGSVSFSSTDGKPHRVLLSGGFNAACNPCGSPASASFAVVRVANGTSATQVRRTLPTMSANGVTRDYAALSEILVTPDVCGPCTFNLALTVPDAGAGEPNSLDATDIRLGLVDLGPVAP